jgi:hypothetical protein
MAAPPSSSSPSAPTEPPRFTRGKHLVRSLRHPLTVLPTMLGGAGAAAVGLFHAGLAAEILAVGGLALGASSALFHLAFRGERFRQSELERYAEALREEARRKRRLLERELEIGRDISGFQDLVDQALSQLDRLLGTRKNVDAILRDKLNEGELTFGRYAASAGGILEAIETNLQAVSTRFKSLRAIDLEDAREGIRRLKRKVDAGAAAPEDLRELKAFEDRLALLEEEKKRVSAILKTNEEAITQLDHTVVALAGMRTGKADATDLSGAVRDLEDLADRAKRFDVNKLS